MSPVDSPYGVSAEAMKLWQGTAPQKNQQKSEDSSVSLHDVMMVKYYIMIYKLKHVHA